MLVPFFFFRYTVIDDKTCEERLWNMKHRGETNFYLCEINRDMVIDATYKGNKSRYINHSCCPNTEMQKWSYIDPLNLIYDFTTKKFCILYLFSPILLKDNWWWNEDWHICDTWHFKGRASNLWLPVWPLVTF